MSHRASRGDRREDTTAEAGIAGAADRLLAMAPELRRAMDKAANGAALAAEVVQLARLIQLRVARLEAMHSNPALVIFGNPRRWTRIGERVYAIEYRHRKDRQNYRHDFAKPATMFGLPNGDVLFRLED